MRRISLEASGRKRESTVPTVRMVTGAGNIENNRFILTNDCCTDREIDQQADGLIEEIQEWRTQAKRELKERGIITEKA